MNILRNEDITEYGKMISILSNRMISNKETAQDVLLKKSGLRLSRACLRLIKKANCQHGFTRLLNGLFINI
jgi:hypothetical protein